MVPVVEILMHAYMAKPAPPAPLWPGAARIQRVVVGHPGRTRRVDANGRTVADSSIPCRLTTITCLTQQPRPPSSPHPKAEQKSKTISDESTTQHHESNLCFHSFLPPADADADAPTPLPVHPP
ncbi:hypothetical protein BHE74_00008250 [Ensete ventricosum]|nr:hypothetical protein GW17_00012402 [Ensete ventricosum]RWW83256.1 hypothetical protein BHE74_00008250 [Ensete ventricosum]